MQPQEPQEPKSPVVGDTWFRCRAVRYASVDEFDHVSISHPQLTYDRYLVERVTPKGVWVDTGFKPRFVRLSANKRFAHPTKEEALQAFLARKTAQLRILNNQVRAATEDKRLAERELQALRATVAPPDSVLEPA